MYLIFLENRAKKELKLQFNPFLGEKMAGEYSGSYRIKIPPLRIIYLPDFKNKIIRIRAIGFRGDVYK